MDARLDRCPLHGLPDPVIRFSVLKMARDCETDDDRAVIFCQRWTKFVVTHKAVRSERREKPQVKQTSAMRHVPLRLEAGPSSRSRTASKHDKPAIVLNALLLRSTCKVFFVTLCRSLTLPWHPRARPQMAILSPRRQSPKTNVFKRLIAAHASIPSLSGYN